jgi:hypothetical protein
VASSCSGSTTVSSPELAAVSEPSEPASSSFVKELREVRLAFDGFGVRRTLEDDTLAEEDQLVGLFAEGDRVGAEQTSLVLQETFGTEDAVKKMASDVRIDGT